MYMYQVGLKYNDFAFNDLNVTQNWHIKNQKKKAPCLFIVINNRRFLILLDYRERDKKEEKIKTSPNIAVVEGRKENCEGEFLHGPIKLLGFLTIRQTEVSLTKQPCKRFVPA